MHYNLFFKFLEYLYLSFFPSVDSSKLETTSLQSQNDAIEIAIAAIKLKEEALKAKALDDAIAIAAIKLKEAEAAALKAKDLEDEIETLRAQNKAAQDAMAKLAKELAEGEASLATYKNNDQIKNENYLDLLKHPIKGYCPNPALVSEHDIINNLLAIIFSKNLNEALFTTSLEKLAQTSYVIHDIFSIIALETYNQEKPLSILFPGSKISEFDPNQPFTNAYYDNVDEYLVLPGYSNDKDLGTMVHEMAHRVMSKIFNNDGKPYNTEQLKEKYHQATKDTLINIKSFIKQNFDLEFIFENSNDSNRMGKDLFYWLFPQYLNDQQDIAKYIDDLKQYDLSINQNFCWLYTTPLTPYTSLTPLMVALDMGNLKLADALLAQGATLIGTSKVQTLKAFNPEARKWININLEQINANYQNYFKSFSQEYEERVDNKALYQPINHQQCPEIDNQKAILNSLENLLGAFDYNLNKIDDEIIVRYPQIISNNISETPIIEFLKPLDGYWQEVVSPTIQDYQIQHYDIDLCGILSSTTYST